MKSLLSRLSGTSKSAPIEPRDIFMTLPKREKGYEYPRDVQTEVWKKWFDIRDEKNCVIKMNTGSGKTVVGLIVLQSCLNEGKGPAIYLVPNKFLINQVCAEAKRLGIKAVTEKDDYEYTNQKAILVTTIHAVVNGRTSFGIHKNYPIGSVIFDDVHACLDTIGTSPYTLFSILSKQPADLIPSCFVISDFFTPYDLGHSLWYCTTGDHSLFAVPCVMLTSTDSFAYD